MIIDLTSSKLMSFFLLGAFYRESPRERLVLVFLGEFVDVSVIPVPFLTGGSSSCTDQMIRRSFRRTVLGIFLSAQGAKSCLLLIISCVRR